MVKRMMNGSELPMTDTSHSQGRNDYSNQIKHIVDVMFVVPYALFNSSTHMILFLLLTVTEKNLYSLFSYKGR